MGEQTSIEERSATVVGISILFHVDAEVADEIAEMLNERIQRYTDRAQQLSVQILQLLKTIPNRYEHTEQFLNESIRTIPLLLMR